MGLRDLEVFVVTLVLLGQQAPLDPEGMLARMVWMVCQARRVSPVLLDPLDKRDLLVQADCLVILERQVPMAELETRVQLGPLVPLDKLVLLDNRDFKALQARLARLVPLDFRAPLDPEERRGIREIEETRVHEGCRVLLGLLALLETREILVSMASPGAVE